MKQTAQEMVISLLLPVDGGLNATTIATGMCF